MQLVVRYRGFRSGSIRPSFDFGENLVEGTGQRPARMVQQSKDRLTILSGRRYPHDVLLRSKGQGFRRHYEVPERIYGFTVVGFQSFRIYEDARSRAVNPYRARICGRVAVAAIA